TFMARAGSGSGNAGPGETVPALWRLPSTTPGPASVPAWTSTVPPAATRREVGVSTVVVPPVCLNAPPARRVESGPISRSPAFSKSLRPAGTSSSRPSVTTSEPSAVFASSSPVASVPSGRCSLEPGPSRTSVAAFRRTSAPNSSVARTIHTPPVSVPDCAFCTAWSASVPLSASRMPSFWRLWPITADPPPALLRRIPSDSLWIDVREAQQPWVATSPRMARSPWLPHTAGEDHLAVAGYLRDGAERVGVDEAQARVLRDAEDAVRVVARRGRRLDGEGSRLHLELAVVRERVGQDDLAVAGAPPDGPTGLVDHGGIAAVACEVLVALDVEEAGVVEA